MFQIQLLSDVLTALMDEYGAAKTTEHLARALAERYNAHMDNGDDVDTRELHTAWTLVQCAVSHLESYETQH